MSLAHLDPERLRWLALHADRWGSSVSAVDDVAPSTPSPAPALSAEERQQRANQAAGLTDAEYERWSKTIAEVEPAVVPKRPRPPSPRRLAQLGVTADELREFEALGDGATDAEIRAALERARGSE